MRCCVNFFIFQWPSKIGGADTRAYDLIHLLLETKKHTVTCVTNDSGWFKADPDTKAYLESIGVVFKLPQFLHHYKATQDDIGFSCCNFKLFEEKHRLESIKRTGMKFIWANDMMWHKEQEIEAIKEGLVDCVLYTSIFHHSKMAYAVRMANKNVKEMLVDNYFMRENHRYVERTPKEVFAIGNPVS